LREFSLQDFRGGSNSQECPANTGNITDKCFNHRCILEICPYGRK
ncbi:TPA: hypothetical protein ACHKDR_005488, partial [Escherichia coli]